tara:strand:+ start:7881 stop:8531 length:651 start_codon:yes stop_codon:yes gene_type:complete
MAHNSVHGPVEVPNNTGPYGNPTNLLHSKSSLSLLGNTTSIESMDFQEGTAEYNRGLSSGDANPSPFDVSGNTGEEGHLVDLLTKNIESTRLNSPSPAQSPQYMGPGPSGDLDLEGEDPTTTGGAIPVFTTGLGPNDGKKLPGTSEDLHVGMLHSTYSYTHAAGTPWQTDAQVGNTPSLSPFQDLTDEFVTGPLGSPADMKPSWDYKGSGPSDGRY